MTVPSHQKATLSSVPPHLTYNEFLQTLITIATENPIFTFQRQFDRPLMNYISNSNTLQLQFSQLEQERLRLQRELSKRTDSTTAPPTSSHSDSDVNSHSQQKLDNILQKQYIIGYRFLHLFAKIIKKHPKWTTMASQFRMLPRDIEDMCQKLEKMKLEQLKGVFERKKSAEERRKADEKRRMEQRKLKEEEKQRAQHTQQVASLRQRLNSLMKSSSSDVQQQQQPSTSNSPPSVSGAHANKNSVTEPSIHAHASAPQLDELPHQTTPDVPLYMSASSPQSSQLSPHSSMAEQRQSTSPPSHDSSSGRSSLYEFDVRPSLESNYFQKEGETNLDVSHSAYDPSSRSTIPESDDHNGSVSPARQEDPSDNYSREPSSFVSSPQVRHNFEKCTRKKVSINQRLIDEFLNYAFENLERDLEFCGVLVGKMESDHYFVTHCLIPDQEGTPDACHCLNEMDLFEYQSENDLLSLGWIHTHPTQKAFLSTVDLVTQYGYQCMIDESVAVVCAPKAQPNQGIFRIKDVGFDIVKHAIDTDTDIAQGKKHARLSDSPLYETCTHVECSYDVSVPAVIVDLRKNKGVVEASLNCSDRFPSTDKRCDEHHSHESRIRSLPPQIGGGLCAYPSVSVPQYQLSSTRSQEYVPYNQHQRNAYASHPLPPRSGTPQQFVAPYPNQVVYTSPVRHHHQTTSSAYGSHHMQQPRMLQHPSAGSSYPSSYGYPGRTPRANSAHNSRYR